MRSMTLAAVAALILPATTFGQEPKTDTYYLQVAAAAAGFSGGAPVWIVICESTGGNYKVVGGYATAAEAQESLNASRASGKTCGVEGPIIAGTTSQTAMRMPYGGGCKKGPDSDCVADSTRAFIDALSNIQTVTLTYRLRDGRTINETFDPRRVEAVFFTMAAVDRMLVPYFVRVYGINGAVRRRNDLMGRYNARDLRGP